MASVFENLSCQDHLSSASYEHYFPSAWTRNREGEIRHRQLTARVIKWMAEAVNENFRYGYISHTN